MGQLFNLSPYGRILVLDSQVVLEGRPLDELPWHELETETPILLLCTPTMLAEVDKFKRDGRLGTRARSFNRLVEPAVGAETALISAGPPRVEIALVQVGKIDWLAFDDLDRESGDDRIVAEALNSMVSEPERLTLFSYDLRPRSAASRHGMKTLKPNENWLLPVEPGPREKETQRLKQRIQVLEASQPELSVALEPTAALPAKIVSVLPLNEMTQEFLANAYLDKNPPTGPARFDIMRDYSYGRRYDEFEEQVRKYGAELPTALELLYNQLAINLTITAPGSVGAHHLELQLEAKGALLHDKIAFGSALLPSPPKYKPSMGPLLNHTIADLIPERVGRTDVVFDPPLERTSGARLICEDFRHGRTFSRRIYVTLIPRAHSPATLEYRLTAINLNGDIRGEITLPFEVENFKPDDLVDFDQNKLMRDLPLMRLVKEMARRNEYDEIDLSRTSWTC